MTRIKYVDAKGKLARVTVWQGSYSTYLRNTKRGPTVAEADEHMRRLGFRRAGRRWKRAAYP